MKIRGREYSKVQIGCGVAMLIFVVVCVLIAILAPAQPTPSSAAAPTATTRPASTPTPAPTATPTPIPTRQATNPVCNAQTTNTPCVLYASIQDAAAGEASVGAEVYTSMSKDIVKVRDDLTYAGSSETTLNAVQFQCFNIQQALWYMNSTINADGSQTIRKSAFIEVDIAFINQNTVFASCRLTSAIVDKIDRAGMWTDGDYVGAWALYDSTSFA